MRAANSHPRNRGSTMLELVVMLAVLGLAGWLSVQLLHQNLRQYREQGERERDAVAAGGFGRQFRELWESRCADPFHPGEWFSIEGEERGGWLWPQNVMIRHYTQAGGIGTSELTRKGEEWIWTRTVAADPPSPPTELATGFKGRIRIHCPGKSFRTGEPVPVLWIELGRAGGDGEWRGFSIVGNW